MNYDAIKIWVDIAQFAITGAIGIYIWFVNKGDATNRRIDGLERTHDGRLDDHQDRISKIEEALQHMPTHNDLSGIKSDIASLKSETHGQTELLKRLEATVGRISDWLIDRAK